MADRDILNQDRIRDYIDDRLNERDRASVAAYLIAHPDLGSEVETLRRQNEALKAIGQEILDEPVPARLRAALQQPKEAEPRETGVTLVQPPPRRPFFEAAAAVFLFVLGSAAGWFLHANVNPGPSEDDLLTSQIAYAYEFYQRERDYPIDFAADRSEDFDGWINRSFTRSLPPPDLARFNFAFAGGRLMPTARTPVGLFAFENDRQERLGVFFWQRSPGAASVPLHRVDQRTALKVWTVGDLSLAVISDRNNPDFETIADEVSAFYDAALSVQ